MSLFKSVSVWLFVILAVLVILQFFPVPGVILMMSGAPILAGFLANAVLCAIFVEAVVGRTPRVLIALPVLLYGVYYTHFFLERAQIVETTARLAAINPGLVLAFDPARHSIVKDGAGAIVTNYDVPVAYEDNRSVYPVGSLSYRLLAKIDCNRVRRDPDSRVNTFGVHFGGMFQKQACELRFPEAPPSQTLKIVQVNDPQIWKHPPGVTEVATNLVVDEKVLATYRTAVVFRLPVLPLGYIGCTLDSGAPAWRCGAGLRREFRTIDGIPQSVDRAAYDTPTSIMLGLRKRTRDDMSTFSTYPEAQAAIERANTTTLAFVDNAFAFLEAVLRGDNPKPTSRVSVAYTLQSDMPRLSGYAERMVERLAVMLGQRNTPNYEANFRMLADCVAKLPDDDFARVADSVFELVRRQTIWDGSPGLYIRASEAGAKTFDFYKSEFLSRLTPDGMRIFPLSALCHLGIADEETLGAIRNHFVDELAKPYRGSNFNLRLRAYGVVSLKFGERHAVADGLQRMSIPDRAFFELVLNGRQKLDSKSCSAPEW